MSFRSSVASYTARLLLPLLATLALLGVAACRDEGTGLQMASTLLAEIAGSEKPAAEPSRVLDTAPDSLAKPVGSFPGYLEVLNGCGTPGAADVLRDHLIARGFDVVETGNAPSWNFRHTTVALRRPDWEGAQALVQAMGTDRVVLLQDSRTTVDATIYVGQDYEEYIHGQ